MQHSSLILQYISTTEQTRPSSIDLKPELSPLGRISPIEGVGHDKLLIANLPQRLI